MTELIQGGIFGGTAYPTETDKEWAKKLAETSPLVLCQALNKWLNKRGLCIMIETLDRSNLVSDDRR